MTEILLNTDYKSPQERYSVMPDSQESGMLFYKKIWRVDDVAKFLGVTVGHIYNLASNEKIPKRKKRGILFFVPNEILNWVLEGD